MPDGKDQSTDALRKQLKENSRLAAEAAIRAGVELHPRIAAIKASAHIDVHVDDPRAGSVSWETAVEWLRGRL